MRSVAMQSLTNDIEGRYPGVTIWGKGDQAHQDHPSDHNEDDTPGSKPAQSDSDTKPEHRAIDVNIDGVAFTHADAQVVIDEVISRPENRERLTYINYKNEQWNEREGWHDNSDDPHPTHIHFSSKASSDEDGRPWLTGSGGTDVLRASRGMGQNGAPPHDNVLFLQRNLNIAFEGDPRLTDPSNPAYHPLIVDGNYGGNTAYWVSVGLTGGDGNLVDGNQFGILCDMVARKRAGQEIYAHNATMEHGGGTLPESVEMTIPAYTVPAQTVTVPIES